MRRKRIAFLHLQLRNANKPAKSTVVIKACVQIKAIHAVRSAKHASANPMGINTCATRTKPNEKIDDRLREKINPTWCIIIP